MRQWNGAIALIAIGSGCGVAATTAPSEPARPILTLTAKGFLVGEERATIGVTTHATAIALASRAVGRPTGVGNHGDCGQGEDIGYAKFAHDFELSFVKGRLSGWTEDGTTLATDRGLRVGATVAALRKAYPDVSTDPGNEAEGGLGPSFQSETGPAGWLSGVKPRSIVAGIYTGATCLSGI